mmetsp:Transcript_1823/g.4514  ORF Transcript_1823/g.4514 Transcript_1823/m.4514 type:complete len:430 (+) Transcript_1823:58-1347(+)
MQRQRTDSTRHIHSSHLSFVENEKPNNNRTNIISMRQASSSGNNSSNTIAMVASTVVIGVGMWWYNCSDFPRLLTGTSATGARRRRQRQSRHASSPPSTAVASAPAVVVQTIRTVLNSAAAAASSSAPDAAAANPSEAKAKPSKSVPAASVEVVDDKEKVITKPEIVTNDEVVLDSKAEQEDTDYVHAVKEEAVKAATDNNATNKEDLHQKKAPAKTAPIVETTAEVPNIKTEPTAAAQDKEADAMAPAVSMTDLQSQTTEKTNNTSTLNSSVAIDDDVVFSATTEPSPTVKTPTVESSSSSEQQPTVQENDTEPATPNTKTQSPTTPIQRNQSMNSFSNNDDTMSIQSTMSVRRRIFCGKTIQKYNLSDAAVPSSIVSTTTTTTTTASDDDDESIQSSFTNRRSIFDTKSKYSSERGHTTIPETIGLS